MTGFVAAGQAGISSTPVDTTTKRATRRWKEYQDHIPELLELQRWDEAEYNIALICGQVSGRLVCIDIEAGFLDGHGLPELAKRLKIAGVYDLFWSWMQGYCESTPSGGMHILVRLEGDGPVDGNTKLAVDKDGKVLIETRGEGGYVIVAPSRNGDRGWELMTGGIDTICYCTLEEWAQIEAVLASFDAIPAPPALTVPTRSTVGFEGILAEGPRWIDELKQRLPPIRSLLEQHGWIFPGSSDEFGEHCVRPGKNPREGHSANLSRDGYLWVHSTNANLPTGVGLDAVDLLICWATGQQIAPTTDQRTEWFKAQRPAADRGAGASPGGGPEAAVPNLSPEPCLEDWFWEATPLLRQLRDSAMERGLSPDGVFGAWLSDYATTIPMGIWVAGPPRRAPLNMYCVLVGSSGTGKTGSMGVADELLGWNHNTNPHVLLGRSLRSGEGLPKLATIPRKKGDLDDGSPSYHNAVQICFDEGGVLGKQADRQGSTSIPYLNTAWSGSGIVGGALAQQIFEFPANLVRICCVMGVQYGAAANLFTGEAALLGFPQRLLYFGLSHPNLATSDVDQQASEPAHPLGHPFYTHSDYTGKPIYLHLPDHIEHNIRLWTQNKDHGDGIDDPLDAHQMNLTKRAASILTLAHGESSPSEQSWVLAQHVYDTSRKIRRRLIASLGEATMERRRARINEAVDTADALDNRWILRRATRLARYIHNSQEPVITKDLRRRLAGDEKPRIKEILDYAQDRGWVIHKDARWHPGGSQPA